ncbi:hypothetical protein D3C75_1166170 [compost metagenome]
MPLMHSARRRSFQLSVGESIVGGLKHLLALFDRLFRLGLIHVPVELLSNRIALSFCCDQISLKLLKSCHGQRAIFFLLIQLLRRGDEFGTELL